MNSYKLTSRLVSALCFALPASLPLEAQTIAITGGKVYPVSGPAIEGGTVAIERIAAGLEETCIVEQLAQLHDQLSARADACGPRIPDLGYHCYRCPDDHFRSGAGNHVDERCLAGHEPTSRNNDEARDSFLPEG